MQNTPLRKGTVGQRPSAVGCDIIHFHILINVIC